MSDAWVCGVCGGEGHHLTTCGRGLSPKDIKIASYEAMLDADGEIIKQHLRTIETLRELLWAAMLSLRGLCEMSPNWIEEDPVGKHARRLEDELRNTYLMLEEHIRADGEAP